MTSKQLIQNAIAFKPVPRTPVAVLDGYNWMQKRAGITADDFFAMEDEKAADFVIGVYDEIESDFVYANAQANSAMRSVMNGPKIIEPKDVCAYNAKDVFAATENHERWKFFRRQLALLDKKIGSEKFILAFGTGPLTSAAGTMGMENLMMALHENPEDMQYIIDFSVDMTIKMINDQLDNGASAVSIADPVSSINLISGEFFEKYSLPGLKRIFAETRRPGVISMLHICGDTTTRLEPLIGSGIDIFSLDSVDINDALTLSKGDYAIFGNLSTVEIMLQATPEKVYDTAKKVCDRAGLGGGFILAPGCDLPPATPIDNIRAMVRAAKG